MKSKVLLLLSMCALSSSVFAANKGKITHVSFISGNSSYHPNVVQFAIEGGFSGGDCLTTAAAVRKEDSHLVSGLLAAHMAGKEISVSLNVNDKYWDGGSSDQRCTVNALTIN